MKIKAIITLLLISSCSQIFTQKEEKQKSAVVENYSNIVLASYEDSLTGAKELKNSIDVFLKNPSNTSLEKAKQSWIKARNPYLQTEAYRFYEGPIDFENQQTKEFGPEIRLNSWPLNEAYIDYVKGNSKSGIINDLSIPISAKTLKNKNQQKDEADVTIGYHAIEFLLWGQDFRVNDAGNRKYTDYLPNNKINERRRIYLKASADLLVDDLQYLVNAWGKNLNNYRQELLKMPSNEALGKIITGIASMSGNEFANERINNALISGDQEDEQSCFSDNTKNDYIYNFRGIKNVYLGKYEKISGPSISDLLIKTNPTLNLQIISEINSLESLISQIDQPFDSRVLASNSNSLEKQKMHNIVEKLHKLAVLFAKANSSLGTNAVIISE